MKTWAELQRSRRVADAAGYAAFISYSHAADGQLGPAVERGLERLTKPWYRRRAVNVFRDDTELAVTHALWSTIAAALDQSEFFVLLASPEAARSEWVGREIERWKATKSVERILLIVTGGQCHWEAGDFDPERSTAIPPSLFGVFAEEPRWLDLSWAREETHLDLRHSRFRDAIAQLAAPIHGRPKDELEAEDIHQHRRTLRLAWSAMAILLVLTVVASVGWVNAVSNARRADQQRDTAVSRQLSAQSQTDLIDELPRSVLLSLEAIYLRATPEARGALLTALQRTPGLLQVVETSPNKVVTAVAWSPSGRQLAWGETNGDIVLWDVEHVRRNEPPLRGHSASVYALAFSPDGQRLASGSWDGSVRVWDLASSGPREARVMAHGKSVQAVAFSPDGQMLASAGDGKALLWSVSSQQRVGPVMPGDAVAFSPEGRSVAVASKSQLTLWDVGRGEMIESHTSPAKEDIQEIVFDKAGTTLASSSVGDGLVVLWDVRPLRPRGEPLNGYQTPHQGKLGSSESNFPHRILREGDRGRHVIAFSHDGTMLVSGGIDDSIVFWDVKKGQSVGYYPTNRHEVVYGIAFSPKDDMLATATSQGDVLIWNNGNVRRISSPLSGHHRAWVNAVTFSRDGKTIVSADQAGTMQIWDVSEMRAVGEPMMHPGVARLSLSPDGRTLASSGSRVVLWDMASRKRIAIFGDESTGRLGASFSPDGSTVASANGKTVVLWDVNTKSIVRQFMGHRADVGAVKFSLDGRTLASSGADRRILLWDLHTGKRSGELVVRDGFLNFALSPDGKMVATGSVEGIGDFMLWDVRTGSRVAVLTGHEDAVSDLAFSPDGKVLVSASHDGSLFLWDVDNRDRMGPPLRGHRNSIGIDFPALVLGVALSGSGDSMVSVGTDGHVVLWDLRLASWIDWGCKLAARNLSQAEWDRFLPGKSYQRTCRDLPSGAGAPANAPASIPQ